MLAIREYVQQIGSLEEKDVKRITVARRHFDQALDVVRRRQKGASEHPPSMVA